MGMDLTIVRRLWRRLDRAAVSYEATVNDDLKCQDMDWMVTGLLCLWVLVEVGVLMHYLRIYPLF